jgi:ApaG protein
MSERTTDGVRVQVDPRFHPDKSDPAHRYWFFSYTVTIENRGREPVQLVSRHWRITDATGHVEHVRGPGVVGETPRLEPGEGFVYTSFCPLPTPLGAMEGEYHMRRDDGTMFDAVIDAFALEDPESIN